MLGLGVEVERCVWIRSRGRARRLGSRRSRELGLAGSLLKMGARGCS